MKIKILDFFIWSVAWLSFLGFVLLFVSGLDMGEVTEAMIDVLPKTSFDIFLNNSRNFLAYLVLFPIGPVLFMYELLMLGLSLFTAYSIYDAQTFWSLLLPHGWIEFPNLLFYSFLSYQFLKTFIRNPKIGTVKQFFVENYLYYLISYGAVVVAAVLEVHV